MFLIPPQWLLPILILSNKHKQFYGNIQDYWDQVNKAFQPALMLYHILYFQLRKRKISLALFVRRYYS